MRVRRDCEEARQRPKLVDRLDGNALKQDLDDHWLSVDATANVRLEGHCIYEDQALVRVRRNTPEPGYDGAAS
jgi:hypothetical protein